MISLNPSYSQFLIKRKIRNQSLLVGIFRGWRSDFDKIDLRPPKTTIDGFAYNPKDPLAANPNLSYNGRKSYHANELSSGIVTMTYNTNHTITLPDDVVVLTFGGVKTEPTAVVGRIATTTLMLKFLTPAMCRLAWSPDSQSQMALLRFRSSTPAHPSVPFRSGRPSESLSSPPTTPILAVPSITLRFRRFASRPSPRPLRLFSLWWDSDWGFAAADSSFFCSNNIKPQAENRSVVF